MTYTGIDYHKRYSVASSQDEKGARLSEAKLDGNAPEAFAAYFKSLPGPHRVVIEACWNWPWLYDTLSALPGIESVTVSHPGNEKERGQTLHFALDREARGGLSPGHGEEGAN